MPPGAGGTGPIRPAFDDLRCGHLLAGKQPPGSLFARTVSAQPAQTNRLAHNHLFEDRAPLLSRRRSPNVPSDISMAAPVGRLPQVRESYSRRVGQTKNAAVVQTFHIRHYLRAYPRAKAGVAVSLSVATHQGSLPVAYRLYLPKDWAEDPVRRAVARVPDDIRFQTKPEIAQQQ